MFISGNNILLVRDRGRDRKEEKGKGRQKG
jgi:hypothetical protein